MIIIVLISFMFGLCLRLIVYNKIALVNERKLKSNNAKEYGKKNSITLNVLHYMFMGGCIIEAYISKTQFDVYTIIGLILYAFSYIMLFYVITELKDFWTTKLIVSENHQLNTSFLFKFIKHPNYFFNLIPELVGFALICKAKYIFIFIFPCYLITLIVRISIEQKMMKNKFSSY